MTQPSFNAYGAVDLGALRSTPRGTAGAAGASGNGDGAVSGDFVIDVTEASFQTAVVNRSMTVPVVIDFWAEWCGPCKQLSPALERLAAEYDGRWVLAKVDVDANQRISAAAGVQSIPTVVAVVKGQPVPLFVGAIPEAQVRQYIDELLKVAEANGVNGRVTTDGAQPATGEPAGAGGEQTEPPIDPRYAEAYDAIERGDLDGAIAAYRRVLAESPADEEARLALAQVELLRRTGNADVAAARRAAADRPDDVAAQTLAADLDVVGGFVEDAFDRLVDLVRRSSGEERDAAREHLVQLFDVVGSQDPRVGKARQALASALF